MKTITTLILLATLSVTTSFARVSAKVQSKFRTNLYAIINTSIKPSGFDSLKYTELSRGVWNCKLELDGFLLLVQEEMYNPEQKLQVAAISVSPDAQKNARMLVLNGIPGYTMKDSDFDKSVVIDRARESRKVEFYKKGKFADSKISVIYTAHQYGAVTLLIESTLYVVTI